jgi:hypothetical protein
LLAGRGEYQPDRKGAHRHIARQLVLSLASTTDRGAARNGSPFSDVALDLLKDLVK